MGATKNPLGHAGGSPLPLLMAGPLGLARSTYRKDQRRGHATHPRRREPQCGLRAGCCPLAVDGRRLRVLWDHEPVASRPAGAADVGADNAPVRTGPLQRRQKSTRVTRTPGLTASRSGPFAFPASGTTTATNGRSSTGRAPVSNTGGWGFESLRPCESWKVPRAPDPRPGREAGQQRGTGLTVTRPWVASPDPDPSDGEWGRTGQWTASGRRRTHAPVRGRTGAVACRRSDPRRRRRGASAAADASVGQLVGPPGCRPGPLAGVQVRVLPGVLLDRGGTSRWPATAAVSKTEGPHGRASSILAPSASSVGPAGVDARLSSGRSRVRVPYGARMPCAEDDRTRPHEVVAACRILSPVARVQVPVGVQMLSGHDGAGTGVQACLARRPVGVRYPIAPPAGTAANPCTRMKRMWTRTCLPCRRQPVRGRSSARSRCSRPAWRNQVDARRSERRVLRGIPVRVRGRVRNGLWGSGHPTCFGSRESRVRVPPARPSTRSPVRCGRLADNEEVGGSNPPWSTSGLWRSGSAAVLQTVERGFESLQADRGAEALLAARPVEARQGEVRFLAAPPAPSQEHDAR